MRAVFFWKTYPFYRYTIPLMIGILTHFLVPSIQKAGIIFLGLTISYVVVFFLRKKFNQSSYLLLGIIAQCLLWSLGIFSCKIQDEKKDPDHIINFKANPTFIIVEIVKPIGAITRYQKFETKCKALVINKKQYKVKGKILLYNNLSLDFDSLLVGDLLLIKDSPHLIKSGNNPGQFDFSGYYARKNIFHQIFLQKGSFWKLAQTDKKIIPWYITMRNKAITGLSQRIVDQKQLSVILSLLLGDKSNQDPEIRNVYANVGVMHILAVSGLHVGVIFILLNQLFSFLHRFKSGRWLFLIMCLSGIWSFALITGLSVSVTRAAFMFSLILVGKTFKRNGQILNSMAIAAFVLLLVNVNFLYDVGFQLSFLAVFGIVVFQPIIYSWWKFKNKWLKKVWMLGSVTLAAQLVTAPISIYYFHQFPTYFLLANYIAIPAASTIIIVGALSLLEIFLIPSFTFVSMLLSTIVAIVNWIFNQINSWPGSVVGDLTISLTEVYLCYGAIACFFLFFKIRRLSYLLTLTFLSAIFCMIKCYMSINSYYHKATVFYDHYNFTAIERIQNGETGLWIIGEDSSQIHKALQLSNQYHRTFSVKKKTTSTQFINLKTYPKDFVFLQLGTKRCLWLNREIKFEEKTEKINIDYLVVNYWPVGNFEQLQNHFSFDQLIVTDRKIGINDITNDELVKIGITNIHFISIHGALVTNQ